MSYIRQDFYVNSFLNTICIINETTHSLKHTTSQKYKKFILLAPYFRVKHIKVHMWVIVWPIFGNNSLNVIFIVSIFVLVLLLFFYLKHFIFTLLPYFLWWTFSMLLCVYVQMLFYFTLGLCLGIKNINKREFYCENFWLALWIYINFVWVIFLFTLVVKLLLLSWL